ncbi:DUF4158 domain-containing protein [Streptomyces sp. NBC_01508]|uniref:DUF4158 domain-containing protein n=1 Tax=Streptomyces sp. NBC_01508 TaxID=2903888 RepID=UPI002F912DBB
MAVDFLSDDQVSRYGRFASEPTPGELEQFFRLDPNGHELVASKRRDATMLGFAVQWGTVRMLGTFLLDDPARVPRSTVAFVAEQLRLDPACLTEYASRAKTAYEHTWEIRDAYGYREFSAAEDEVRAFLAARVWASLEGPRALFDRAVVWLVDNRVLLPGITTLTRLVAEVRASENTALYRTLDEAVPGDLRQSLRDLLKVPEGKRVSELERLRTPPTRVSGTAMTAALQRAKEIQGLGAHLVATSVVPAARMSGLARYGMGSKAPTLRDLEESRKTATLLATVQRLETATVDDALDLLDVLMSSRLLSRAERVGKEEKLKSLPRLRRAAGRVARAVGVLLDTVPATDTGELVSVVDAWSAIEKVVPREKLAEALAIIAEVVPDEEGDEDAEWRAALATRYSTVRGFIRLLVDVVDFGAVQAGVPVVKALKQLPHLIGRKKIDDHRAGAGSTASPTRRNSRSGDHPRGRGDCFRRAVAAPLERVVLAPLLDRVGERSGRSAGGTNCSGPTLNRVTFLGCPGRETDRVFWPGLVAVACDSRRPPGRFPLTGTRKGGRRVVAPARGW